MSSPSPSSSSPAPYHRIKRAPITPPLERPSWYPPNDERHSEANHIQLLEEARLHHERILHNALRVLRKSQADAHLEELALEQARLDELEQASVEAARVTKEINDRTAALEAKHRADAEARAKAQAHARVQARANAQKAQEIAQAPPPPVQLPAAPIIAPQPVTLAPVQTFPTQQPPPLQPQIQPPQPTQVQPVSTPQPTQTAQPATQTALAPQNSQASSSTAQTQQAQASKTLPPPREIPTIPYNVEEGNSVVNKHNDRLEQIHKTLKELRKRMQEQFAQNPRLKTKAGEMRRLVRVSVGQLTGGEGNQSSNRRQIDTIINVLSEALNNEVVPNALIDPSWFIIDSDRQPVKGANNGQLPFLFLFLMNHFSKAILSQLAVEAGIKPHTAASIGILAVRVFSEPTLLWRGKPLTDILIAKYRMVCPVLFGIRGNENDPVGKTRLGWKKIDGKFIHEEAHANRMTAFGAGYAAICLRDFSRGRLQHPYAVACYWMAFASIVSTPSEQVSKTQCFVLKAMIDTNEKKFLRFYGSAALAALQVATIHFPARLPSENDATRGLSSLPAKMKLEQKIDVVHDSLRA